MEAWINDSRTSGQWHRLVNGEPAWTGPHAALWTLSALVLAGVGWGKAGLLLLPVPLLPFPASALCSSQISLPLFHMSSCCLCFCSQLSSVQRAIIFCLFSASQFYFTRLGSGSVHKGYIGVESSQVFLQHTSFTV